MPSLPPSMWAELFYGGAWHDVTGDLLQRTPVTVTRGLSSESASQAEPTSCTCDLDSRDNRYAPRNPASPLYGLIGRNTGFRWGYEVGGPWVELTDPDELAYQSVFVSDGPALDVAGDIDLRLDIALEDWSRSQLLALRAVSSANYCWALMVVDGVLTFQWYPGGTTATRTYRSATAAIEGYRGQRMTVRATLDVNNGAGGHTARFYTGRTVDDEDWHMVGDPVTTTGTTSLFTGTAYMEIGGSFGSSNLSPSGGFIPDMRGRAYALQLRDGIDGTVKVDMSTAAAVPGGNTWVDATGLTWSRSGTATLTNRHIRMAGEVPAWPPTRDLSGNDNYVSITPSGVTRRMDAGNRPQESALLRFIKANDPIECWPLTDGPRTTGAKSLVGGQDMQPTRDFSGTDTPPDWQKGSLADWIEPVLSAKANTTGGLRGGLPRTSPNSSWSMDLFLSGGGAPASGQLIVYDRGAGTDEDHRVEIHLIFAGGLDQITATYSAWGDTDYASGLLGNIAGVGIYDEEPHHLRLAVDPAGSDTAWYLYVDGELVGAGTISGVVMQDARQVALGWGGTAGEGQTMTDRSFGYLTYWGDDGPTASEIYTAYMGFPGERAGERIVRLATEAGYTASVAGEPQYQQLMGIQGQKTLLELLHEASATDFGFLLDRRDAIEVIHRGQSTLWNQTPALVLDYSAGLIASPFKPVDDDKLTENDVAVQREFGSLPAREVLEEGAMSVLPPEDGGVGRYDTSHTYSLYTDAQAAQVAGMRLHLGTYAGVRYTRLTLNLANSRVYEYIDDILRLDVGDKIRLTNLPADHGPDDVDVLVAGYTEDAGPDGWTITFTCLPGEPWTAAVVDSFTSHADTDGSELAAAATASATTLSVATTAGPLWVTAAPNTVPDPGFEQGTGAWRCSRGASIGVVSWERGIVHSGSGAARLTRVHPTDTGTLNLLSPEASVVPAAAGQVWAGSAWVFSAGATANSMRVAVIWRFSDNSEMNVSGPGVSTRAGDGWVPLSITATAPAGAVSVHLLVEGRSAWTVGEYWIADDVRLARVDDLAGTDMPDEFPFEAALGGEVVTVHGISGTTSPQTFTVTRSANGIAKAHAAGTDVRLAHPVYVAM